MANAKRTTDSASAFARVVIMFLVGQRCWLDIAARFDMRIIQDRRDVIDRPRRNPGGQQQIDPLIDCARSE